VSRGPNFILGRDVVDVLLDFRHAGFDNDNNNNNSSNNSSNNSNNNEKWREWRTSGCDDDDRVSLPEYNLPLVTSLYPSTPYLSHQQHDDNGGERRKKNEVKEEEDDLLEPSIASLVEEVKSHLHVDDCALHEVCIAGEGEVSLYEEGVCV
jgi:hypothetical protein